MPINMYLFLALLIVVASCTSPDDVNQPEKQVSFARESKPHDYYVSQAELWWKEIEKDASSEDNWYNYYRACRNAQGTADWRENFVKESPFLRLGNDIVHLMKENIPGTFTYYFVKGSTGGVDPGAGKDLMKAYRMNPEFAGIHPNVVTYATSIGDPELRKEANLKWYKRDDLNPGLLLYGRNVLDSAQPNGILLTQHDNDTYPVWMVQDAEEYRTDVTVINIDFLLGKDFRKTFFDETGIPPFKLDSVDVDDYRENWTNVVHHLLAHYSHQRPLQIGLTVSQEWYSGYQNSLQLVGLTWLFSKKEVNEQVINTRLIGEDFNLENLNYDFKGYAFRRNVIDMNVNYLKPIKVAYDEYRRNDNHSGMVQLRKMALGIAARTEDQKMINRVKSEFGSN